MSDKEQVNPTLSQDQFEPAVGENLEDDGNDTPNGGM